MKRLLIALAAVVTLVCGSARADLSPKEAYEVLDAASLGLIAPEWSSDPMCSAGLIAPDRALTAKHCINPGGKMRVEAPQIGWLFGKSVLMSLEQKEDWAVLNLAEEAKDMFYLNLGCTEELYPTKPVAYMGYPDGIQRAFFTGMLSVEADGRLSGYRKRHGADWFLTPEVAGGSSGSPVISMETGAVIGIITEIAATPRAGGFLAGMENIANTDLCDAAVKAAEEAEEMGEDDAGTSIFYDF